MWPGCALRFTESLDYGYKVIWIRRRRREEVDVRRR